MLFQHTITPAQLGYHCEAISLGASQISLAEGEYNYSSLSLDRAINWNLKDFAEAVGVTYKKPPRRIATEGEGIKAYLCDPYSGPTNP